MERWLEHNGGVYRIDDDYGDEYAGVYSKIRLICPAHGVFHMRAGNIAKGQGCPACGSERRAETTRRSNSNIISAIEESNRRYTFVRFEGGRYVCRSKTKVIRDCPEHGSFSTLVGNVLSHHIGCPSCANYGYDDSKPGHLYGLLSTCGKYLKIGITNKLKRRLARLERATPFEFHVLNVYKDENGTRCRMLESYFHKAHKSAGLCGFDGATEWMLANTAIIAEFTKLCNEGRRPRGWRK